MMHIEEQCYESDSVFTVYGTVTVRSSNGVFRVTKSKDLAKYRLTEVADPVDGGEKSVDVVGPEAERSFHVLVLCFLCLGRFGSNHCY